MHFFLLCCILISQSTIFKRCVTKLFLFLPLLLLTRDFKDDYYYYYFGDAIIQNSDKVAISFVPIR